MHTSDHSSHPEPSRVECIAGLSLGGVGARSSLAAVRRTEMPGADAPVWIYQVVRLHRWDLRAAYTAIAADVPALLPAAENEGCTLVVDASIVGTLADLFLHGRCGAEVPVHVVNVVSGVDVTRDRRGGWNVPEAHLAAAAITVAESGRLTFAAGVPFAAEIPQELRRFASRAAAGGRRRETDDLAGAVAVAVWAGENLGFGPWEVTVNPRDRLAAYQAPAGVFAVDHLRAAGDDQDARLDAYDRKEMGEDGADDPTMGGLLPPGGHW